MNEMKISNPVLRGFYPDPSIVRAGDTYYIANSTFEWYPGVSLHKSTDLVHWIPVKGALDRAELLDMKGNPYCCGVWAPDLTYADGKFWLLYSDVKVSDGPFKDIRNYLTVARNIEGPWSKPYYLRGLGFDASIFHDDDGKKYIVQQQWDHREYRHSFDGIVLTELDTETLEVKPETRRTIYAGTEVKLVEGPHIYKKDGYYYLFAAQGGTVYTHQEVVARSKTLDAFSFETEPKGPFITNFDTPDSYLQKQGHGSLVDTPSGEWYYASLCGRPWHHDTEGGYDPRGWCTLGRETALQKVFWDEEGWPRIEGGHGGMRYVPAPQDALWMDVPTDNSMEDKFEEDTLDIRWNTLRQPFNDRLGRVGGGKLVLRGQGPLTSTFDVSLVARRWQCFNFDASVCIEFKPEHYQEMAGLVNMYNDNHWSFLHLTHYEDKGAVIELSEYNAAHYTTYLRDKAIAVPDGTQRVYLKAEVRKQSYSYLYSFDGTNYERIPVTLDAAVLSDDYVKQNYEGFFTGAMVGLACVDMTGFYKEAVFTDFLYSELGDDYTECK